MNWSSENTIQDKLVNFMENVRKYKIYLVGTLIILFVVAIFLLYKVNKKEEIYIELIGSDIVNLYAGDTYQELGFNTYDVNNKF